MYPLTIKTDAKELAFENDLLTELCHQGDLTWGDASALLEARDADPIPALYKSEISAREAAKKLLAEPA